jgi:hypothetical protein
MSQTLTHILQAPRILLAKQTVQRSDAPFDLDLGRYAEADYTKFIPALREIEARLRARPADARGLRWIHLPDTVLFLGTRRFDIAYEDFVSRVDIGHVGQFYRDSIGAETVVTARDTCGRALHQGVRVVALPQPNYAGLMGKGLLDVYKLECIDYGPHEQRVWMLTVHSPNGSAVCDDGFVAFRRTADGTGTEVEFMACQNFPIPPLMALARLDRWRWFKTVVTESAYRRFFDDMMHNVQACWQGVEFRVGRCRLQAVSGDAGTPAVACAQAGAAEGAGNGGVR